MRLGSWLSIYFLIVDQWDQLLRFGYHNLLYLIHYQTGLSHLDFRNTSSYVYPYTV